MGNCYKCNIGEENKKLRQQVITLEEELADLQAEEFARPLLQGVE